MSLDGFVAGPDQSVDNPLGIGGMRLHEWVFPLAVWRAMHGLEGGEVNESTPVVEESLAEHRRHGDGAQHVRRPSRAAGTREAVERLVGRRPAVPSSRCSCSRTTRASRSSSRAGPPSRSSPSGIEPALEQARRAAGGKDVSLAGGAKAAQQYLAAGLVDEMEINLVPTLLGQRRAAVRRGSATTCTGSSSCERSPRRR